MASKRAQAYKKDSLPEKTIANRVEMWRRRIADAQKHLHMEDRMIWAERANIYLSGGHEVPTRGKAEKTSHIYFNYSLPLTEELHRESIPSIPTPSVDARTKASAALERVTQQFLSYQFDKYGDHIISVIDDGQWDDDKMGVAVFRADWKMTTETANPTSDISQENVDIQRIRADKENLDSLSQVISDSDLDVIHLPEHEGFLSLLEEFSEEYTDLQRHIQDHRSRLTTITKEGVRIERVGPDRYVFDDSAGWEKRAWEMEIKSVRVKFLIENGYQNVNPKNAPPEDTSVLIPYEDKTVKIGEIHDRFNNKEYVIPLEGEGDKFLMDRPWRYGDLDIYKLITFHPYNPDQSWGVPLMLSLIPILEELSVVDFFIQRHVKSHPTPKIFIPSGAGSDKIKKGIKDTNQMIIEVSQEQSSGINIYNPPAIPPALTEWRNSLINELRRAAGLDAQDTGQSNPHQVTATESFARSRAGEGRIEDRQRVIVSLLSWFGEMFLELYRRHAMNATEIEVNRGDGPKWELIEPRDLPVNVDIAFDIEAVTDRGREEKMARADRVLKAALESQIPIDRDGLLEWYFRELGVKRPGQFRVGGAPSPENIDAISGSPGTAGGSEAPIGTEQNTDANARFGGGAKALAETAI